MKKIFLFILLLVSIGVSAQVKQTYNQYGGKWKRLQMDSAIKIPMTIVGIKDANAGVDTAQLVYDAADSTVKVYTGSQWLPLGADLSSYLLKSDSVTGYTTRAWLYKVVDSLGGGFANPMTTLGDIIIGGASGAATRLGIGTNGQLLRVNAGGTAVEYFTPTYLSSVPTLQQVLDAGSTLTSSETINVGANTLNLIGSGFAYNFTGGAVAGQITGTTNAALLDVSNSATNSVSRPIALRTYTSGTVAANYGVGIQFDAERTAGSLQTAGYLDYVWTDASGTYTSNINLTGVDNTSLETFMNIQPSGVVRVNNLADTLATKAYARSVGGGSGSAAPDTVNKLLTTIVNPTTLTFNKIKKERWLGFIDEKDELLNLSGDILNRDDFYTTTGPTVTKTNSNGNVVFSIAGGSFTVSTIQFDAFPQGSFSCMEIKIKSHSGGLYFGAGMFKDSSNFFGGAFEMLSTPGLTGAASSIVRINGGSDNVSSAGNYPAWSGELTLYVMFVGDYVRFAYDDGSGAITWGPSKDITYSRAPTLKTVLNGDYKFGLYLATGGGGGSVTIKSIRAGYFKGVGLSDISFVNKEDGTPLIIGNSAFFTGSIKGHSPNSDASGMCTGVYRINMKSFKYERMSLIFRDNGTNIINDAAPCLVYDTERKRFKYFVPPWGEDRGFTLDGSDFRCYYKEVDDNLITGVHVIDSMTALNVGSRDITYDFAVVKQAGTWYIGLSYYPAGVFGGNFRFALVSTTDFSSFTTIEDDAAYNNYEGQKIVKIADTVFVVTSGTSLDQYRLFYLDGTDRGTIASPITGLTQPSHPAIIPFAVNGKTKFHLLTFDTGTSTLHPQGGTQILYTNGNFYIYVSNQHEVGYEYPIDRKGVITIDE
jgi:hypothetical protein